MHCQFYSAKWTLPVALWRRPTYTMTDCADKWCSSPGSMTGCYRAASTASFALPFNDMHWCLQNTHALEQAAQHSKLNALPHTNNSCLIWCAEQQRVLNWTLIVWFARVMRFLLCPTWQDLSSGLHSSSASNRVCSQHSTSTSSAGSLEMIWNNWAAQSCLKKQQSAHLAIRWQIFVWPVKADRQIFISFPADHVL